MKNLKGAKELLEIYKSITIERLEKEYKRYKHINGKQVMYNITNFGSILCMICKSASNICSNCIYSFIDEKSALQCMDIIYKEMEKATSAEELFNAIQKRISYLTHVIEWYETNSIYSKE
jgi:hypothetical protein